MTDKKWTPALVAMRQVDGEAWDCSRAGGMGQKSRERWGGAARQGQWQERISKCDSCLEGRAHRTRLPLDTAMKGEGRD